MGGARGSAGADRPRLLHVHCRALRGGVRRADRRSGPDGPVRRCLDPARWRLQAPHLPYAFQGLGRSGLEILAQVRETTGMPIVTEIADARDVDVLVDYADMLQIGTRNMANFGLLQAVGESGKPVLLKRGMSSTVEEWLMAAEYIAQRGNLDIVLCERGIRTFEPSTRNTLDISAVPVVQAASHLPIVVDPSHAAGRKDLVVPLSRAAIAVGADGLLVDVHPNPEVALCDGPQAVLGTELRALAQAVRQLPRAVGRVSVHDVTR
nr:3-deoxy-7-phosphoheptulonate synthase [Nocardioides alcanivorans]